MPIRPENRGRYPANWRDVVGQVRARSGDKCEQCQVANGVYRVTYADGLEYTTTDEWQAGEIASLDGAKVARIVLTVAHLDHQPENCDLANLRHWCQRCHNRYDAPMRARGMKERRPKPLLEEGITQ